MQLVALTHDTADRNDGEPELGLGTIDQLVPSHRSTNVPASCVSPTATQSAALTHDTPEKYPAAGGVGLVTIDHDDGVAPAEGATAIMTDATRPTDTTTHRHTRARKPAVTSQV